MRLVIVLLLTGLAAAFVLLGFDASRFAQWIAEQQRAFQNQIAGAVQALKSGQPGAYGALFLATGAYGFFHALGPGHGKYLVGGVGLGTEVSSLRLVSIAVASSLAQSATAIALVYLGFYAIEATAQQMTTLTERVLAPASYAVIGLIGLILVWRGLTSVARLGRNLPAEAHDHSNCGHAHGPSHQDVAGLRSFRDAMALIVSIAIRPCTGAIFLLVIAWQMDLRLAGALAVAVMGLGTAALTSLVALSSVAARNMAVASTAMSGSGAMVFSGVQVVAGLLVVGISLTLLGMTI